MQRDTAVKGEDKERDALPKSSHKKKQLERRQNTAECLQSSESCHRPVRHEGQKEQLHKKTKQELVLLNAMVR